MSTITLEEAQRDLRQVIERLAPGDEIVVTSDDRPIAALRAMPANGSMTRRQLGTLQGSVVSMSPDFDAIPEGFEEYVN